MFTRFKEWWAASALFSLMWWKASFFRALRTAAVIATPYVPTVLYEGNYFLVLSAAGFGALGSIVTSLFGVPETDGTKVAWYFGLLERAVKTAAQALVTLFGTATLFSEVNWTEAPQLIGTAVLGTLLLGFLKVLPETELPLAQAATPVVVVNNEGERTVQEVPVVTVAVSNPDVADSGTSAGRVNRGGNI